MRMRFKGRDVRCKVVPSDYMAIYYDDLTDDLELLDASIKGFCIRVSDRFNRGCSDNFSLLLKISSKRLLYVDVMVVWMKSDRKGKKKVGLKIKSLCGIGKTSGAYFKLFINRLMAGTL